MHTIWWATPDIDKNIAQIARVSNPDNQTNTEYKKLLVYMANNGHVSPFEMVNVCMEINTTRDIARQILRHRSFSFQEFSQRYQTVEKLGNLDEINTVGSAKLIVERKGVTTTEPDVLVIKKAPLLWIDGTIRTVFITKDEELALSIVPSQLPGQVRLQQNYEKIIFWLNKKLKQEMRKNNLDDTP